MANRSRVLVTGGAGFIGRRMVRALLPEGHEVTVVDLRAFPDKAVRSVIGDLCDPDVLARAVRPGTDVIMHLAAITSVLASVQDPVSTHRLNVDATARLLELARVCLRAHVCQPFGRKLSAGPGSVCARIPVQPDGESSRLCVGGYIMPGSGGMACTDV